jgi:GNAT superfamily N-acetyltransferase
MKIKPATRDMASTLTELVFRSKSYWGYENNLMKLWKEQLKISPEYIEKNIVDVAYIEGKEAGFFSINIEDRELEDFWVDPEYMGKGVGRGMFKEVRQRMEELSISEITIISDPNALAFYEKMGAQIIGESESVPPGRKLPKLKFTLKKAEPQL